MSLNHLSSQSDSIGFSLNPHFNSLKIDSSLNMNNGNINNVNNINGSPIPISGFGNMSYIAPSANIGSVLVSANTNGHQVVSSQVTSDLAGNIQGLVSVNQAIYFGNANSQLSFYVNSPVVQQDNTALEAPHTQLPSTGDVITSTMVYQPNGSSKQYSLGQIVQILYNYGLLK